MASCLALPRTLGLPRFGGPVPSVTKTLVMAKPSSDNARCLSSGNYYAPSTLVELRHQTAVQWQTSRDGHAGCDTQIHAAVPGPKKAPVVVITHPEAQPTERAGSREHHELWSHGSLQACCSPMTASCPNRPARPTIALLRGGRPGGPDVQARCCRYQSRAAFAVATWSRT
jgi:hypothetical protein